MIVPPSISRLVLIRVRVDRQARQDLPRIRQTPRGKRHDRRQGIPFDLPLAGRTLVSGAHGGEQSRDLLGGQGAHPDDDFAGDRIGLLRHRRRGAAMVAATLPKLADLGPGQIDHFACDLSTRRADGGKDETDFRQVVARGMPGNIDGAEPEPIRYQPTDLAGLRPERRGSPAGSEE